MTMHINRAPARPLERKDDSGGRAKGESETLTKSDIADLMTAVEEFKATNDERISQLEKRGVDPVTEGKLQKIEKTLDRVEELGQKYTLAEKTAEAVADLDKKFDALQTALERTGGSGTATPEEKAEFHEAWCRSVVVAHTKGEPNLSENQRKALERAADQAKALNLGSSADGGYLAPTEYVREIIKTVTEMSPVRALARVRQTSFRSVEYPKRTGQFAAQWVGETETRSETTGLTYGMEELTTHELYALIDITNQMLEDSAFNMQSEITMESAEQFALAEGTAFVTGSGVGKPYGFMQDADVASTNSGDATEITADGVLTMKYTLKSAYASNASFVMNRTTMGKVRRLKASDGTYLWQPGIADGRPNTLDGDPYIEVPDMPSEGAGLKPMAYGDFRRGYLWVDRIGMEMLRDPYTQATGGKLRFIMRKRVAGKVILPEAIKTLTCAA